MPFLLADTTASAAIASRARGRRQEDMETKTKALMRRQMAYGFEGEKDSQGRVIGASVVRLARRNAFEMVGLRRPAPAPGWRWHMG